MSYLQNDTKKASSYGEQFPSDAIKNLAGSTSITSATSKSYRYTFLSYFLRANYSYMGKYLLSGSIRTDGSSRFGPNKRYGWFPAVSGGWVLSEEKFLKDSKFLSFLKLRASWGLTGNAEIGESQFLALYGVSNYPNLPGYVPVSIANPNLKWEKTAQTDIGLEFSVLNNRLSGEVDVYKKHTSDLLLTVNTPATTGYTSYLDNLGTMENKGIEISLTSINFNGLFKWSTTVNAAYNKNKVLNIKGQIIEGGYVLTQRAVEGLPIGEFYGQKFLGVDPQTGDALFLGEDGKPTSDFDNAKMVTLGNSNPKWTGGFTNTFSYKGFDLNIFFMGVFGNKVNNAAGYFMSDGFYNGLDNQTTDILNAWQKPGDKTNVPRIGYQYGSGYQSSSSRWLYNGSYVRLKDVKLGYNLPKSVVQKLHISSARIYVEGTNLWITTDYHGDPEVNAETISNIGGGQDFYTIPQARTYSIGIDIKF
jgi:TonB-linked SusC/RagA family outer membrane protein